MHKKTDGKRFITSHVSYVNCRALPTLTSALILSVTSITNSVDLPFDGFKRRLKIFKSTVAPTLPVLSIKQYSRPCNITLNNDLKSLSWELTKRLTKFHCSTKQQHTYNSNGQHYSAYFRGKFLRHSAFSPSAMHWLQSIFGTKGLIIDILLFFWITIHHVRYEVITRDHKMWQGKHDSISSDKFNGSVCPWWCQLHYDPHYI